MFFPEVQIFQCPGCHMPKVHLVDLGTGFDMVISTVYLVIIKQLNGNLSSLTKKEFNLKSIQIKTPQFHSEIMQWNRG